ncbi:hypothetical protein Pmar_PMAR013600 [Perkinsus marinus ATCC 50983]|uniref:Uncharacterized protein n=1 Tax=Perkinsus marinus (strain ATCC 50983 / TXsc) TaxID=423536 RepID=C5K459_PERM5|nr:hypothetical protein Pmar_PMAR013600 [Perkinsus marinus ATCC 50983]EER20734.1 hypothetical protein Pmar_PMAR013600 [Perkinsus marinus ATCC 50983]|eukprot:XP_002788938.1 hypothetical protein Pmar_PMAR013600 [Perkinsus marinus ATCC 50983]
MVRVKLTKTIPGDKFGFVNQAPLLGAAVMGGPTCLEVNGVKLDLKEMREALKTDSVDMEVYVPIET